MPLCRRATLTVGGAALQNGHSQRPNSTWNAHGDRGLMEAAVLLASLGRATRAVIANDGVGWDGMSMIHLGSIPPTPTKSL